MLTSISFPRPVLPSHDSSAYGSVAHVSAAVGNKHGCRTDSRELAGEEVIARFSETAAPEFPAAADRDGGKGNTPIDQ